MTLGLGLLGIDGWVLASDTLASQTVPVTREELRHSITAASFSTDTRKIIWNPAAKFIFACSGNHLSRLAGEEICNRRLRGQLPTVDSISLATTANHIWQLYHQPQQGIETDIPTVLLISVEPPIAMWTIYVRSRSEANEQTSKQLIGDINNGAKLFLLLYYSKRPIKSLNLLAVHTILMAHRCAPGVIDGLEIWTGDNSGNVIQVGSEELES